MEPGIQLDQKMTIEVMQGIIAQDAVTKAQMESAIQSLMRENAQLKEMLSPVEPSVGGVPQVVNEEEYARSQAMQRADQLLMAQKEQQDG